MANRGSGTCGTKTSRAMPRVTTASRCGSPKKPCMDAAATTATTTRRRVFVAVVAHQPRAMHQSTTGAA